MTKNTSVDKISIGYNNMFISNTKFLGIVITNSLSWKDHITQLTPKLCKACYVLRCIRPFISQDTLKSVYYSYFHSLISYRIIFWGNSSNSLHVFRLKKRAITIISGSRPRNSCRGLFKKLRIQPLQSQYTLFHYSLWTISLFHVNSEVHGFNTRQNSNLHQPQANLSLCQKGAYYSGIKFLIVSSPT